VGEIACEEKVYRHKESNQEIRPFVSLTQVRHRGYSLKLERASVDLGADVPFRKADQKLQEHYGISIGQTAIRRINLKHAKQAKIYEETAKPMAKLKKDDQILSETDGTMIPVIEHRPLTDQGADFPKRDQRKNKQCVYKEMKLTMARLVKSGDIIIKRQAAPVKFEATTGDVEAASQRMKHSLSSLGATQKTKVHAVGDGALWIEGQYRQITKGRSNYLIDFYHLMEYLKPAGKSYIDKQNPKTDFNQSEYDKAQEIWLETAVMKIKESRIQEVVEELRPFVEPTGYTDKPIRDFVTYIDNRPSQFNYKAAIEDGLPIGSGEIESAHKSLIQRRVKIPGAWWEIHNADHMVALRTLIANGHWENYWQDYVINNRLS
jgi:hypothetical protein